MGVKYTQALLSRNHSDSTSENALKSQERSEQQKIEMQKKITKELRLYSRRK
ncbi:hypothetical protein [Paenisporosarcina indica]|uniref:hypothetical protein n=1 Tax=Paenisporosarcina indica TaxID=650093 RepID=UPI000B287174|nr:hypothetical protein [Paenisporosarcina indica]